MCDDPSGDPYGEATAEFYDLLATGMWASFGPALQCILADVDPDAGPVVDLGAGTGAGIGYIHAAVPTARIVAIEPSRAMRVALHGRLAADERLRELVSVVPMRFEQAALPRTIAALVASAVLGHLDASARDLLWQVLSDRLAPGAPAVIGVLPPERPEAVPPTRYRALPVGDHVYEGWMEGEVFDERRMRWTMSYRVVAGEAVIYERRASSLWITMSADDVAAEVDRFGLTTDRAADDYVIVRRPA